ncbi:MAG: hypothetical protein E6371_04570 [Terrisporobacter othiniensis]|uniref:hypothetical protein n=1 Tax=Terrisporobacter othiniensis TaxID=1577792 RepID=UPI0029129884|nr:hypothetical protein [Terrisporobacter othiniensis]MDU6983668.1 hypothetical protein [Terrisporobacter othiniensis]
MSNEKVIDLSMYSKENINLHLSILQEIIKRMADNSFKIKGWSITLVSALLGLLISNTNVTSNDLFILLIPIIGFGFIDAYYLRLERVFRNRYESDVKKIREGRIEEVQLLSFSSDNTKSEKTKYIEALLSKSILLLYIPLILSVIFIIYILKN